MEHLCGYAQSDLLVPLLTEASVSGQPVSVAAANATAAAWCAEVNARIHSEIAAVPDDRLAIERELLAPLPSLRLEIGSPSVTRKVDRLSCVRYGSALHDKTASRRGRIAINAYGQRSKLLQLKDECCN